MKGTRLMKGMLSVNGRISRNVSYSDITWIKRPKQKIGKVFNWKISGGGNVLMEITYGLSKERLCEVNELRGNKEKCF